MKIKSQKLERRQQYDSVLAASEKVTRRQRARESGASISTSQAVRAGKVVRERMTARDRERLETWTGVVHL